MELLSLAREIMDAANNTGASVTNAKTCNKNGRSQQSIRLATVGKILVISLAVASGFWPHAHSSKHWKGVNKDGKKRIFARENS